MRPSQYALNEYRQTAVDAGASYADPHALISMLFNGLQERIAVAKGAMARGDIESKGRAVGRAMDIVGYLQSCLDLEAGGELAGNLYALYTYATERLFRANLNNDVGLLDEVSRLMREVQLGWEGIRETGPRASNKT